MYKILLVDDDLDLLSIATIILEKNNFLVSSISKWEEIYASINDFHPDLILLDTYLNGADGRDICKKLKTNNTTKNISILLNSAAQKIIENPVNTPLSDGFIEKPYNVGNLVAKINSILSANTNS
jgi:DNA-binding response OmpR family regulator